MSILENKYEIIDEEENKGYTLPAVVKKDDKELSFKKAVAISTALHPLSVGLAWLLVFILGILGIHLFLFNPPEMAKKDLEFVLVDRPDTPRDPNTRNRSDMSSRSGGERDMSRPVSMPTGTGTKPSKPSAASASLQKMVQKQQQAIKQEQTKKVVQQQKIQCHL